LEGKTRKGIHSNFSRFRTSPISGVSPSRDGVITAPDLPSSWSCFRVDECLARNLTTSASGLVKQTFEAEEFPDLGT